MTKLGSKGKLLAKEDIVKLNVAMSSAKIRREIREIKEVSDKPSNVI